MTPRQQLRARYPAILAHASLSFGDGWVELMDVLCERLQHYVDQGATQQVEITQAKEKYGELSVLFCGGDDHAHGLVEMAEAMSAHICEVCGQPGDLEDGPNVFRTRCPECRLL